MKKFLAAFALLFFVFTASGQDAVMSSWPYLYPEFAKGTVWMNDGKKYERELNIHVAKGRLHFVDGGAIKEANPGEINLVELNGDQFTVLNGDVVKVSGDLVTAKIRKLITAVMNPP